MTNKSLKTLLNFTKEIQKEPISRVWKGYNTYLFLEIGPLHTEKYNSPKGIKTHTYGKYTIEISGHWYIYKNDQCILNPTQTDLIELEQKAQLLLHKKILDISIDEKLTKAEIKLSSEIIIRIAPTNKFKMLATFSHNYRNKYWFTVEDGGVRYESKVEFKAGKNILNGLIESTDPNEKPSLILLHGAGESGKNRLYFLAKALIKQNIATFSFDFSGWGESTGNLHHNSLQNRTQEAQIAIDQFLDPTKPISILACSMAGHNALKLLENNNVQNLILFYPAIYDRNAYDKPFDQSFTEIIRQPHSYRNADVLQTLEQFKGNLLLVIGEKDEVIPKEVITLLDRHSSNVTHKKIITIPNAGHQMATWQKTHPEILKEVVTEIIQTITSV